MRRVLVLASAAALFVAGCGQREAPAPSPEPLPPGQLAPEDLSPAEREAFVYAAAIRHVVEARSETPRAIYVLDRATGDGGPIAREVQDRVREELALLGPIRFVRTRSEVGPEGLARKAVLISLGPLPSDPDRVELRASIEAKGSGKETMTLILKREGLRWDATSARDAATT